MKIEFKQQVDAGPISFSGEFTTQEIEYLCEFAVVELFRRGLIPAKITHFNDLSKFINGPTTEQ